MYVHAGGKIEALGTSSAARGAGQGTDTLTETGGGGDMSATGQRNAVNVETICVVDVRDNNPQEAQAAYELLTMEAKFDAGLATDGR